MKITDDLEIVGIQHDRLGTYSVDLAKPVIYISDTSSRIIATVLMDKKQVGVLHVGQKVKVTVELV